MIFLKITDLFIKYGDSAYGGEAVTQGEHGLQAAHLAFDAKEKPNVIVACLLHDIGHMLHALPDDSPDQGIDDLHERLGYQFLSKYFIPAVSEPVRMHVDAKRYLCAVEPSYMDILSEPSIQSLQLQGGPMSSEECFAFEQNEFYTDALRLRRYDDQAKIQGMVVRPISAYEELISFHSS